ncbi:nucleic acid-binding, OB-fold protein [Artemisia annua]|uniref:Nucleic acid-binding, OB-fold protein n=1 Tax=Artemisia annua TaxID=35608 RepID=A0A2U1LSQ3_ARTAN|nr:nucleic acid-binding, OB-fold protein [Artemisia annua]
MRIFKKWPKNAQPLGNRSIQLFIPFFSHRGETIRCILWNDLGEKLHKYIKDNENSKEPIIVLIIMAKYSTWNSVTQVSNSFFGTKGTEFAASEDTKIELSTNTIFKNPEESYTKFPVKNIDELYEITEATGCVVIGKVLRIVTDQGWYYMICNKCKNQAKKSETTNCYNCEKCDEEASDVYPRVQDETGSASFWLFQPEICKLMGKSPGYLISKAKKDLDNASYPEDLNIMLNKHYVLKVQVSGYNLENNYHIFTANKILDDEDVMKSNLAKRPIHKETHAICEDQNTHSKDENVYEEKNLICDDEDTYSEVGGKRKNNGGETKITKMAKTNED